MPASTNVLVPDSAIECMLRLGYSDWTTSCTLRVYRSRVAQVRAEHSIPEANPTGTGKINPRFSEDECLVMKAHYLSGESVDELCDRYRCSWPTVQSCLASVETEMRPRRTPACPAPKPQPIVPFPASTPLDKLRQQEAIDRRALQAELSRPPAKPIDLARPPAPDLVAQLRARRELQEVR